MCLILNASMCLHGLHASISKEKYDFKLMSLLIRH